MVFFTCSHCGASLKKKKVEKHYAVECRNTPLVSCMDCSKDFRGNEYVAHTKCITEDEKYSGKGFVPKPVAAKQDEWLNIVRTVRETRQLPENLKAVLDNILCFENIPRKKPKFMNFLLNNRMKISPQNLDLLWDCFETEQKLVKERRQLNGAEKADKAEIKDSSISTDKESETSPKAKKNETEKESLIMNGDSKDVPEEIESPTVKTKKNKDKNKRKFDAVDDTDMKISETTQYEELTQAKKSKKKKKSLEGTEEGTVNISKTDESTEMESEEVTQGIHIEVMQGSHVEVEILTKKQKKEKKKREKYEAELREIENSQPLGILPEDVEQSKSKKKSKKDKHVNGLDDKASGVSNGQTGENSLKNKKKRNLENDATNDLIERKKKKGDAQEADKMEETAVEEQDTIPQQKFQWNETILQVVKSKGGEIQMKRLRKKVLSEYVNCCGSTENEDKLSAKFSKKLQKVPGITIHKEVVMLV